MFTSNSTAPWSSRRSSDSNGKFNIQQFEDVCLIQKCKCSIAMLVYQRVCVFLQKGPWLTYLLYRSFWVGCALYLMSWVPCSIVVQHQNTANVFCAVMKLATSSPLNHLIYWNLTQAWHPSTTRYPVPWSKRCATSFKRSWPPGPPCLKVGGKMPT